MADAKAEAERLYDIGERYFSQGNVDKARLFLERAEKLHASKQIKDLLSQINGSTNGSASSRTRSHDKSASSSSTSNGHSHSAPEAEPARPEYTAEQLTEVQRIRRCRDYYEILQIEKTSTDDEVKRAYRKLALKMHPDKNKAPGSTEAFRAVSNAFGVLSDAQKRRQYDLHGITDNDHSTMRDGQAHAGHTRRRYAREGEYFYEYDFTRGFESDMSAEDIFSMFFGGGLFAPADGHHAYHNGHHAARGQHETFAQRRERMRARAEGSNYLLWLQVAPFLVLILLSLLSSIFRADPPFSLSRSSRYPEERETSHYRIKYYVKDDFPEQYGEKVGAIEQDVEAEFFNALRTKCYNEQAYRESMMYRARLYGDVHSYNQARNMALPSCDELNRIRGRA